tara:strand:+ start:30749 stop:31882 length:1134 start_codon:yes stop_codon:yes gene_type:complete
MASIRKRKLPSGLCAWVVDFRDQNGGRRNKNFERKRDAESFLDEVKRQVRSGMFVTDDVSVTVANAAKRHLESAEILALEKGTQSQYEQHTRLYIQPLLGTVLLTHLGERQVYCFLDDVVEAASASMAKKVLSTLSRIIKSAQKRGYVGRNIIVDKGISAPRADAFVKRMPEKSELANLLAKSSGLTRVLLMTAMLTGMRQGELRALTWDDVCFDVNIIRVRKSGRHDGTVKGTKTPKGHRDIPISGELSRVLKEWKLSSPSGTKNLVFPNGRGNMEGASNIRNRIFIPAMNRIGLTMTKPNDDGGDTMSPAFRFHDLRHAAAALFIEQGMSAKRVQELMGHSSVQVTFDVYGYLFRDPDADAAAVDQISRSLTAGI